MTVNKLFFMDLLQDRRMSLRTLAKRMDILPSQLSLTFSGTRRMQIAEAVKIAQVLGAPINEVMVHAGIEEARVDRRRCDIVGFLNGNFEVEPNPAGKMDRTFIPDGLPSECQAVQARTAASPVAWADGWVLFFNGRQPPEELLGRFVIAKIKDGPEVLGTLARGYDSGTYNITGPIARTSQRLEWASPVLCTRH